MSYIPNRLTRFSKWCSKLAYCLLLCSLFAACSTQRKSNHPVMQALYRFTDFKPAPATKAVVIIADNSCIPCNKELAALMSTYITRSDILFVVAAHESAIDLSPYIHTTRKDIVFDYNHSLTDNQVVKGSTVLLLKNQDVDTVIQVDAAQLTEQLSFLKSHL